VFFPYKFLLLQNQINEFSCDLQKNSKLIKRSIKQNYFIFIRPLYRIEIIVNKFVNFLKIMLFLQPLKIGRIFVFD